MRAQVHEEWGAATGILDTFREVYCGFNQRECHGGLTRESRDGRGKLYCDAKRCDRTPGDYKKHLERNGIPGGPEYGCMCVCGCTKRVRAHIFASYKQEIQSADDDCCGIHVGRGQCPACTAADSAARGE